MPWPRVRRCTKWKLEDASTFRCRDSWKTRRCLATPWKRSGKPSGERSSGSIGRASPGSGSSPTRDAAIPATPWMRSRSTSVHACSTTPKRHNSSSSQKRRPPRCFLSGSAAADFYKKQHPRERDSERLLCSGGLDADGTRLHEPGLVFTLLRFTTRAAWLVSGRSRIRTCDIRLVRPVLYR
jgi:hypothetical protein